MSSEADVEAVRAGLRVHHSWHHPERELPPGRYCRACESLEALTRLSDRLQRYEAVVGAAKVMRDAVRRDKNASWEVQSTKPSFDAALLALDSPATQGHGRDCRCTPCRAEDWDVVDAGIRATQETGE